jgi:hypothetical protein
VTQIANTVRRLIHALSIGCALAVVSCLGLVIEPAAHSQILYGTLTGTMRDTSGDTVPNTKVEALETVHEDHTDNALKNFNYFNPPGFHKALNVFNQFGAAVGGHPQR